MLVAAGTSPNITCEKEAPGTFQLDAKKKFFQPHSVVETATAGFTLDADAERASSPRTTPAGSFVTYYGDNHPRYAGNVVKAMASAKDGFPHVVELFARRAGARSTRRRRPARDARVARARARGSTTSSSRASRTSSG